MADERFSEAVRIKEAMTALLNHVGWKIFSEVLHEKEEALMKDFLNPGEDITDIKLRESRMAILNIRMSYTLPESMLEAAKETVKSFENPDDEEGPVEPEGIAP